MAVSAVSAVTVGRITGLLKPAVRRNFNILNTMARSGSFNVHQLDAFSNAHDVNAAPDVRYALASLYLQLNERQRALDLLAAQPVRREMKWYFAVLAFSFNNQLPVPALTAQESDCISYLSAAINPAGNTVFDHITRYNGFSVIGNAPGNHAFENLQNLCAFYFNDYRLNPRIKGNATVHVVTPSYPIEQLASAKALLITGNSIFHRRSLVWQKFLTQRSYDAIYTLPRTQWDGLSQTLDSSPSAGLLILDWLANELNSGALKEHLLSGIVGGFSAGLPARNHTYDKVPASGRHNWAAEAEVKKRCMALLRQHCDSFTLVD